MPAIARRAPAAPATGAFNRVQYDNTIGRVGYHMFTVLHVDDSDTPTGSVETCEPRFGDLTVSGTLPPGLSAVGGHFEGTPRQPGDWFVNVTVGTIICHTDPIHTDDGPKTVAVHFHINP